MTETKKKTGTLLDNVKTTINGERVKVGSIWENEDRNGKMRRSLSLHKETVLKIFEVQGQSKSGYVNVGLVFENTFKEEDRAAQKTL